MLPFPLFTIDRKKRGFTLIEMLTAIAIIAVLASILIPAVGSIRKKSAEAKAINSVRQIGIANMLYSQENKGKILGPAGGNDHLMMKTMAEYLATSDDLQNQWNEPNRILEQVVDPSVPENMLRYSGMPFTWSFNSIFHVGYGRGEETGNWSQWGDFNPEDPTANARRMIEFRDPSKTIYVVSGSYTFNVEDAQSEKFLGEPTSRQSIFYYYGDNDKTPGVFLDGHTEMMSYPIDPDLVNPSRTL